MDSNSPRATGKSRELVDWEASSCRDMTYTCAFCKRGFSNAQALGGHMNIHRRERAKLKQAASVDEENFQSVEITTSTPSDHSSLVSPGNDLRSPGDRISVNKRPEEVSLSVEDASDDKEERQQLPLFVGDKVGLPGNVAGGIKEKKERLGQDASSQSQAEVAVDLELRLGPDPRESSGNMN